MKHVKYQRKFLKVYPIRVGRDKKLRKQYDKRFNLFMAGHHGQPINDHALTGSMTGLRSFSVSGDVRVVYRELDDVYEFIDVGTHAQVYGE